MMRAMTSSPAPAHWTALADLAERVAVDAAHLLRDGLTRSQVEIETKSSSTDMVSEMDRAAERLIVDSLLAERPDDAILGEEGSEHVGTSGVRWVIDPLDGTTNYLYRHPGFAVSIAAEDAGGTVAGVVVDIVNGDAFRAVRGGGATRNGFAIAASTETDLTRALVATGFGYAAERRREQGAVLARVIGEIRDIRRMGSAALDLCSVACGRVDAYYELGLAPWDFAAGALIAEEAGAEVTDLLGSRPSTTAGPAAPLMVAAPPALAAGLRALLLDAGAEAPLDR
jgi:myo-inositol-1(or 4)-monophosphatase